jgi:hypothetical protein
MKSWATLHSADWILLYGLPNLAAKFCSQLPWTYWRYPHGLEKVETYLQKPAVTLEDQPIPTRKKARKSPNACMHENMGARNFASILR